MRTIIHYISSIVFISIYGIQVCPFLESLSLLQLTVPIVLVIILQYFLQYFITKKWVNKSDFRGQTMRIFFLHFFLFIFSGLFLTIFNTLKYGFPLSSGMKIIVGLSLLGFFTAVDLALEKERWIVNHFLETGKGIEPDEKIFSVTRKLSIFASACSFFLVGVFFLVLNKDLDWLVKVGSDIPLHQAQRSILIELGFITGVVLFHVLNIIFSYSRNLGYFFNNENRVLSGASKGNFDARVPVSTNDEFGIMARYTNEMVRGLKERTEEVQRTQEATIISLASLAETRDNETGGHIQRTQNYVKVLAEYISENNGYVESLAPETIDLIHKSAPLHDIGKVGIPDAILLKPGKLTDDEFSIMKQHAWLGAKSLKVAEERLGSNSFLKLAGEIALTHHEKWDGSGYPRGLSGDEIPVSGRLMAIADVYDALISKRIYKPGFSHEETMKIILEGRGKHFDPVMVDAFISCEEAILAIAGKYNDG